MNSRRLAKALSRFVKRVRDERIYGILGRTNPDGTVTIVVALRPANVYITMDNGTMIDLPNTGKGRVPLRPGLPVQMIRMHNGDLALDGADDRLLEGDAGAPDEYGVLPHAHEFSTLADVQAAVWANGDVPIWDDGLGLFVNVPAADIAAEIAAAATDDTIADADLFGRVSGGVLVKSAWSNIKALLTTLFDGLYLILAGKAGGQTASGGTASGESLTLHGSAHATKGPIILQPTSGDVVIGATTTVARLRLDDSTQFKARLLFSGQEFFQAANTSTDGVAVLLNVNRTTNRQLAFADSARLTQNTVNPMLRILIAASAIIDAISTDGTTALPLSLSGSSVTVTNGRLQITGNGIPTSGAGFEFGYASNIGVISAYDRDASAWRQIDYGALLHTWNLSGAETARLNTTGLGLGVTAPQGKLHAHDGTGGFLFVSKTGIDGVAQTIVPDGTGDVAKAVIVSGLITNSVPQNLEATGLIAPGGTRDLTIDGGTNTIRFAVSVGGALTVIRQTGAATWSCSIKCIWQ